MMILARITIICAPPVYGDSVVRVRNGMNQPINESDGTYKFQQVSTFYFATRCLCERT
jgi:hypothetical protein